MIVRNSPALPGEPLLHDTAAKVSINQTPRGVGYRRAQNGIRDPGFSGKPRKRLVLEYPHKPRPLANTSTPRLSIAQSITDCQARPLEVAGESLPVNGLAGGSGFRDNLG